MKPLAIRPYTEEEAAALAMEPFADAPEVMRVPMRKLVSRIVATVTEASTLRLANQINESMLKAERAEVARLREWVHGSVCSTGRCMCRRKDPNPLLGDVTKGDAP